MMLLQSIHLKLLTVIFQGAMLFCLFDAVLIPLSLVLADHPGLSDPALIASVSIAPLFLVIGYAAYRISNNVQSVCRLLDEGRFNSELSNNMRGLMTYLIVAGLILSAAMGMIALAFIGRINEGFAIFG